MLLHVFPTCSEVQITYSPCFSGPGFMAAFCQRKDLILWPLVAWVWTPVPVLHIRSLNDWWNIYRNSSLNTSYQDAGIREGNLPGVKFHPFCVFIGYGTIKVTGIDYKQTRPVGSIQPWEYKGNLKEVPCFDLDPCIFPCASVVYFNIAHVGLI